MDIICPHCRKTYQLPEERLPWGGRLEVHCPSCRGTIPLDLGLKKAREANSNPATMPQGTMLPNGVALRKQILRKAGTLPVMPQVLQRARTKADDPAAGARDLAAILETDPALTARVLKLANSAYYGFSGRIATVNQAALLLGIQTIMATILLVGMEGILGKRLPGYRMPSGTLWRHSLAVALASRRLAAVVSPSLEEEAFSAGLLHDAGKLVLDPYLSERSEALDRVSGNELMEWKLVERRVLGLDHAVIGSDICHAWRMPSHQTAAVGLHHRPLKAASGDRPLAALINIANSLAYTAGLGLGRPTCAPDPEVLRYLNLHGEDIERIAAGLQTAVAAITESGTIEAKSPIH